MERIIIGDSLEELGKLPDGIAQTCITSPPYWGLRDYGPEGQIGLEETPEDYVARLVKVFREVRRVLRDDGTLWLNIGDSYNGSGGAGGDYSEGGLKEGQPKYPGRFVPTLKRKDLCMIPARLALALQDDGWYLRSDIIWSKPNCMPESVRDRPTKAHEYIFLFAKSEHYFYDCEAIREEPKTYSPAMSWEERKAIGDSSGNREADRFNEITSKITFGNNPMGKNKRSVWEVPTSGYPGAHFAVYPPALVEPCLLAGTPEKSCPRCGAPWERVLEKVGSARMFIPDGIAEEYETSGFVAKCKCPNNDGSGKAIVLDPFLGSGTTVMVAIKHKRGYIGIELNPEYGELIKQRLAEVQIALF